MNRAADSLPESSAPDRLSEDQVQDFNRITLSLLHSLPPGDPGVETDVPRGLCYLTMRQAYQLLRKMHGLGLIERRKLQVRCQRDLFRPGQFRIFNPQQPDTQVCLWRPATEE